jgi:2-polyprenyl-3-methyl-5-hydroxy-6-metoxy-1,4-benzoquinol methylase
VYLPSITAENRVDFILSRIQGRKVLHLGCADWPFTRKKLQKGSLLHQRMATFAGELVGLDLEAEAIVMMREAGIENLHLGNSEATLFESLHDTYDVIVAGEILEHVLNPGLFLNSIRSVCHRESIVIITTPNFAPIKRLPRLLWRNEVIHPDHVAYYSVSTLTRLLNLSHYQVEEWHTYWTDVGRVSRIANRALEKIPAMQYFADGYCITCKPTQLNG